MRNAIPTLLGTALPLLAGCQGIKPDALPEPVPPPAVQAPAPERWLVQSVIVCPLNSPVSPELCHRVDAARVTWNNTAATEELCGALAGTVAYRVAVSAGLSIPFDYYFLCEDQEQKIKSPGSGGRGPMREA